MAAIGGERVMARRVARWVAVGHPEGEGNGMRMLGRAWNDRQGYETCECAKPQCRARRRAERKRMRRLEKYEMSRSLDRELRAMGIRY